MKDKEKLVLDNLGLVGNIAKKFCNAEFEYEDLFQTGCIGLMKAATRYSNTKFKFSTYAYRYIYGEIFNFINSNFFVHVPRTTMAYKSKMYKIKSEYVKKYGRVPTIQEYINEGIPTNETKRLISMPCKCNSIETKAYENLAIKDYLKTNIDYEDYVITKVQLKALLDSLSTTEQKILKLRMQNKSIQNIAKTLKIAYGTAYNMLNKIQDKTRKLYNLSSKKQSRTKKEIAFEMFEQNVSSKDIAIKLNANYNCITSYKTQWNKLRKVGA